MALSALQFSHQVFIPESEAESISPKLLSMLDYDSIQACDESEGMTWHFPEESGEQVAEILLALMTARITYGHCFGPTNDGIQEYLADLFGVSKGGA